MKKEELFTAIIIIIVIALEIITQNHTKKAVEEVNAKLSKVKEESILEEKNEEELFDETKEIYDLWEEKSKILSYYLEHDELEKVDLRLRVIKANFESHSEIKDEVISEIEEGIFSLEHIKDKQKLNIKNIL